MYYFYPVTNSIKGMMTATRQLLLELTDVETAQQALKWSTRLETAWEWGLISRNAYELLKGELEMHMKYEGIEKINQ
jgi:hypothetical protein